MGETKGRRALDALPGYEPEIGRWLAALEETRGRTLRSLRGLSPAALHWTPAEGGNSIGALLYHVAAIEADWVFYDVFDQPFPPEVGALLPHDVRDGQGQLTPWQGATLDELLHLLDVTRRAALAAFRGMTLDDFQRPRLPADEAGELDAPPVWILHHLMQHEGEHRGHIQALRERVEAGSAPR